MNYWKFSPQRSASGEQNYLNSTVAPASVNFFLMVSASSFETPSLTVFGAPSTRSLASFRPRLVTSRTALITLILLAPTSFRTTVNSVFSSAGAAPAPTAAPPPATITGAAAAADTPRRDSSFLTSSAASSRDKPTIDSCNFCRSAIVFSAISDLRFRHRFARFPVRPGHPSAPDNARLQPAQPLASRQPNLFRMACANRNLCSAAILCPHSLLKFCMWRGQECPRHAELRFLELLLLHTLVHDHSQVAADRINRRHKTLCRSIEQEQKLGIN